MYSFNISVDELCDSIDFLYRLTVNFPFPSNTEKESLWFEESSLIKCFETCIQFLTIFFFLQYVNGSLTNHADYRCLSLLTNN